LVDYCTTIIGEINMINNVNENLIPPIWRHEKLIRLKPGVMHRSPQATAFWSKPSELSDCM